jgi:alpha-1,2-mannosyltransferase
MTLKLYTIHNAYAGQVDLASCDYLIDLDFPSHPRQSTLEPRFITEKDTWETVYCRQFLDAAHSSTLTRILWLPGENWQTKNEYGDYCLLRHRERALKREG